MSEDPSLSKNKGKVNLKYVDGSSPLLQASDADLHHSDASGAEKKVVSSSAPPSPNDHIIDTSSGAGHINRDPQEEEAKFADVRIFAITLYGPSHTNQATTGSQMPPMMTTRSLLFRIILWTHYSYFVATLC